MGLEYIWKIKIIINLTCIKCINITIKKSRNIRKVQEINRVVENGEKKVKIWE